DLVLQLVELFVDERVGMAMRLGKPDLVVRADLLVAEAVELADGVLTPVRVLLRIARHRAARRADLRAALDEGDADERAVLRRDEGAAPAPVLKLRGA